MRFNEKLQQLRKNKGITQEELAQAIYVTRAAVNKWERGLGISSKESLKLLCEFFNVKPEEFIFIMCKVIVFNISINLFLTPIGSVVSQFEIDKKCNEME